MDDDQHLAEQPEPPTPVEDALEQTAVPQLGLSVAVLAAIFVGGALGTVARYQLDAHHPVAQGGFPWVTLLINLSGSLAIGFLVPLTEHAAQRAPLARPFLIVGFLGGWTTYSTLAVDATLLARDGDIGLFVAYVVATVAGGVALVIAGHAVGRKLVPA